MKNSVKTVGSIFVIILLSKVLGQIREMMLAACYGTGMEANAFTTASQIPLNFFDMILGMAIVSAFVPVFNEYYQKEGMKSANSFANHFIGIVTIISSIIAVLGVLCSGFLVSLIAHGLDEQTAALTSSLLKIMFPSIIMTAAAFSVAGILQSFGEFKAPAAMSVVSNGITILYLLIFNNRIGIYGLAWSMLLGWSMQLIILIPYLFRFRFKFRFRANFLHPGMKKVYKLAGPILLSSWVQPLNVLVNIGLASFLNEGQAVSAINYANRLYLIIAGVFTMAVTNLILPSLSRLHTAGKQEEAGEIILSSLKAVVLFLMPVMGMFLIFCLPIVQVIYQSGSFDEYSTMLTSTALFFYSFGMLGYGLQEILNKSFYSMQKSTVPMKNAFLTIGINVVLSFVLSKVMGIGGLALAAAIAATVGGCALLFAIRKYNSYVRPVEILPTFLKSLAATVVGCVAAYFLYKYLGVYGTNRILKFVMLAISGGIGVVVYLVMLLVLKTKEVYELLSMFRKGGEVDE